MAATAIGLDVGTNAVRAVEIELSDPPLLRRMGQVALPVGAVVDGEVADVAAVSMALKRLWDEAGFKTRAVRVGMSSARMIVRTVEMPRLSHEELMSTIRLQLDDYVPLPADDTVFDIRELDGPSDSAQTMQLLLAATHRDAVEPLVMALHDAKLNVTAIDVIPAALALALTRGEPAEDGSVDIVLSIGAGTLVVVAAGGGEPLFSRT
ncbi:MAG: type IV pilus biogenesis protein PilM, partial [Ilumatobacteraceae bacterium]